jgi:hypothetical protein
LQNFLSPEIRSHDHSPIEVSINDFLYEVAFVLTMLFQIAKLENEDWEYECGGGGGGNFTR